MQHTGGCLRIYVGVSLMSNIYGPELHSDAEVVSGRAVTTRKRLKILRGSLWRVPSVSVTLEGISILGGVWSAAHSENPVLCGRPYWLSIFLLPFADCSFSFTLPLIWWLNADS